MAPLSTEPVAAAGLSTIPVELGIDAGPVGIVTLKTRTLSPIAQLFIETARHVAADKAR